MVSNWLYRMTEWCLALACLLLLLPALAYSALRAWLSGRPWLQQEAVTGKDGRLLRVPLAADITRAALGCNSLIVRGAPRLWLVLRGRLALVGPGMLSPEQARDLTADQAARFAVRPGLVHSHFLRRNAHIAWEAETETALKDAALTGYGARLGMVLRGLAALLLRGGREGRDTDELAMFGLRMTNASREAAVTRVLHLADTPGTSRVAFINPGCVNIAMKDDAYRAALAGCDTLFPDGIGIKLACRYLGLHMRDNLNGTDLVPALCARMAGTHHGLYLLGARPGVVDDMVARLRETYPELKICGFRHGYFSGDQEEDAILEAINASGATILLVAMGVPTQERWMARVADRLQVQVVLGVGGLFDFMSGRMPRAPLWMREIGMEWLFRLLKEPRRLWRRYVIGNWVFMRHLVRYHK